MISNQEITQDIYDQETVAMSAIRIPHPELHTHGEHATVELPIYALVLGTKSGEQRTGSNQFIKAPELFKENTWQEVLFLWLKRGKAMKRQEKEKGKRANNTQDLPRS